MSDVFQEVEEEYRRQQVAQLWEKYRVPLIGGATALVLGVAAYQGWVFWYGKQVERSSRELEAVGQLMQGEKGAEKDAADRLAKLVASGSGGYPLLAKFQEAAVRAELRDFKAAIALYDGIAKSERDPLFRDFASVRAAVFVVELEPYDNVKKRLEPVSTGTGPWHLEAKELLAYAAWRAGKGDEALKLYNEISKSDDAPAGVKRRAYEMTTLLNTGLKYSDIKVAAPSILLPQSDSGPLLLQPTVPTPEKPSLLGPGPAMPTPVVPTTPTP